MASFMFNPRYMVLSVPEPKLKDLRREATKILNKGWASIKNLSSFVGKAMATTAVVSLARLMNRYLLALENNALRRPAAAWTDIVHLAKEATENLQW
ncbi:hypothetical protein BGZ50_008508 [Haplosporangium sp. Z 11]|nr:hypothetical protein BGZ50_008508 [Haplosporangium sp. Z 11]